MSFHFVSSSLITNLDGEVVQHIEYVPFGEVFIEERNNKWNTPYLFNAKELDEETGLYYYHARYYDSRVSVWLSTDPLQEKYPNISTYAYCVLNPVKYVDPDGREIDLSKLTEKQRKAYNATIESLSESKLFKFYYNHLQKSETTYTIIGESNLRGKEIGGYFNPTTNEVSVGKGFFGYVAAQELFHAYQTDAGFYDKNPVPYSTIEAEGDIMTVYVMIEIATGYPSYGSWMNEILEKSVYDVPSYEMVISDKYQKIFQKAVDDRIQYYKEQGMDTPTYIAPNTGENPKALETVIKKTGINEQ